MTTMPYGERTDEILELARQVRTKALRNLAAMEAEAELEDGHADDGAQVPPGSGQHRRQAQVSRR